MPRRQCYHCRIWIAEGEEHNCWSTTEQELTRGLPEDILEAWERLRETAAEFGEQRIYASHHSIMFSRKTCYFFVRPKKKHLEVCIFLGRPLKSPLVARVDQSSKSKFVHTVRITHRDQVEAPLTGWLREAWELVDPGRPPAIRKTPPPKLDKGKQIARVRRICESIPNTVEKQSHGMSTFLTPKRIFATFADNHHGDGRVAVWIAAAPGVQEALIEDEPGTYFRPPYVGVNGWVGVEVTKVNNEQLSALLREAFRVIDSKSRKPSPRPSTRRAESDAFAAASPRARLVPARRAPRRKPPASKHPPRARAARASTKPSGPSARE